MGRGLFTGHADCAVTFLPAEPGTGVVFELTHAFGHGMPTQIEAHVRSVTSEYAPPGWPRGVPVRNTTLTSAGGASAGGDGMFAVTVEHALSALTGLGVRDCVVRVANEVPIFDGSAQPMVEAILDVSASARPSTLAAHRPIVLGREVVVTDERTGATIVGTPRERAGATYTYKATFPFPAIAPQTSGWEAGDAQAYASRVAPARTFSFEPEAQAAKAAGLFAAFTAKDLLVLRTDGTPIDNTLRFPTECSRHKLLDLIGDCALIGRPLQADVTATGSGHALAHAFCRAVLATLR